MCGEDNVKQWTLDTIGKTIKITLSLIQYRSPSEEIICILQRAQQLLQPT
jgi:hypothetical protein